jgi:hypothetical protein
MERLICQDYSGNVNEHTYYLSLKESVSHRFIHQLYLHAINKVGETSTTHPTYPFVSLTKEK